ncbi:MAG: hypothetical protein ACOYK7_15645 [Pirellulales bacterium]
MTGLEPGWSHTHFKEREMVRFFNCFVLGCLIIVIGSIGLFLTAWAVVAVGGRGAADIVGPLVAIGLSVLLPCSFLAAGGVFPGPPRPASLALTCPNCGGAVPLFLVCQGAAAPSTDGGGFE